MFNFSNKNAIITGAGSGIGKNIALVFAEQGASVCIIDINKENAQIVADEINAKGGKAIAFACNVGSQSEVIGTVLQIYQQWGKIDILVNNAGIAHIGNLENTSEADFDRIFQVNVKGIYNMLYAVIPYMKSQQSGVILNMASVAAWVGIPDRFAYSMSKGAAVSMTLSVAKDYLSANIRCNSISPARVHTPFVDGFISKNYAGKESEIFEKLSKTQPIGRMAKPEEIAALALYLCSDEAGFITGTDYPIDGGFIHLNN
ncbi:MAG: SDR family oxidoreductase [Thermoflexibacter sp.]|nr:SDR family oxidoreductase [Thermoflexibacter sp.]